MTVGGIDSFGYAFRKPGKNTLNPNSATIPVCKLCRHSILQGHPRVWLTKPMGLSHASCAKSNQGDS